MASDSSSGTIAFDFDATLAHYTTFKSATHTGKPIPVTVATVKKLLKAGRKVEILTARVYSDGSKERDQEAAEARKAIEMWCFEVFGQKLPVGCEKRPDMVEIYDDRITQVIPNVGVPVKNLLALSMAYLKETHKHKKPEDRVGCEVCNFVGQVHPLVVAL